MHGRRTTALEIMHAVLCNRSRRFAEKQSRRLAQGIRFAIRSRRDYLRVFALQRRSRRDYLKERGV